MPTFRNVNSGQVVQVEDDPSHLDGLARWVREEGGLSAPEPEVVAEPAAAVDVAVDAAQQAQDAIAEAQADAAAQLAALNNQLTEPASPATEPAPAPATLPKPAADAKRDKWLDYALANGKTKEQLKGIHTTVIASWFD